MLAALLSREVLASRELELTYSLSLSLSLERVERVPSADERVEREFLWSVTSAPIIEAYTKLRKM